LFLENEKAPCLDRGVGLFDFRESLIKSIFLKEHDITGCGKTPDMQGFVSGNDFSRAAES